MSPGVWVSFSIIPKCGFKPNLIFYAGAQNQGCDKLVRVTVHFTKHFQVIIGYWMKVVG